MASFEVVGSIIVIAMLIVPAATAYLLTRRLWIMVVLSMVLAAIAAGLGHVSVVVLPGMIGFDSANTSGMMAVVAGLLFGLAWIISVLQRLIKRMPVLTEAKTSGLEETSF